MIQRTLSRKKILAGLLFAALAIALGICAQSWLANPLRFVIGPLKGSALLLCSWLALCAADNLFLPPDSRKLTAWLLALAGLLALAAILLLRFSQPQSGVVLLLNRWRFLAYVLLFWGCGLRISALIEKIRASEKAIPWKWVVALTLLFLFLSFLPVLKSGFYWDDAFFSVQIPAMRVTGQSIWQRTFDEIRLYSQRGRINPFATFQFLIFYLIPSVKAYKVLLVLLTLLDAYLFYQFLKAFTKQKALALFALMLLPIFIQVRIYHDPMVSYYGLMQTMFAELMLSLLCLIRFCEGKKLGYLLLSLALFLIGLMSYEMFYPMILLYFIVAWQYRESLLSAIRLCLPYILVEGLLFGISIFYRHSSAALEEAYAGTAFSLDIPKILITWWHQTLATFPLSYRLADNDAMILRRMVFADQIFGGNFITFVRGIRWTDLLGLCLGLVLISFVLRSVQTRRLTSFYWAFGALLLVSSGIVIALSAKYQEQILPGLGYIPVFFGIFGACALVSELIWALLPQLARKEQPNGRRGLWGTLALALFAVIYLLNQQTNRRAIELLNQSLLYPRQTGEAALQAGLLRQLEAVATLIPADPDYLWEAGWDGAETLGDFYTLNSGKPTRVISPEDYAESMAAQAKNRRFSADPATTFIISYTGDGSHGLAKIGRLMEAGYDAELKQLDNPVVNDLYFFVYGQPDALDQLSWVGLNGAGHLLNLRDAWLINQTASGTLYKLDDPHALYFNTVGLAGYQ